MLLHAELSTLRSLELQLKDLGADQVSHLNGPLLGHLIGVQKILNGWGGSLSLQHAGLFHAVYGTDGFSVNLCKNDDRERIASIIGSYAERIVYEYCACNRQRFYSAFLADQVPALENRFTEEIYSIERTLLADICELTVANEVEIGMGDRAFVVDAGPYLSRHFSAMENFISDPAKEAIASVFGEFIEKD